MTVRELRSLAGRLATARASLELIYRDDPCTEVAAASGWCTKRLEMLEEEIKEKAVPQRARKTRNGSAREWDQVRRDVRGLDEGQTLLGGGTVADLIAERARAKGLRV